MARMLPLIGAFILLTALPAHATTPLDVSTGLKTLLQITGKQSDSALVVVLYNPADPTSQPDADAIAASINNGSAVPAGLKLTAKVMTVGSFSWIPGARAAFLAQGFTASSYAEISKTANASGAVTMSADLHCVKANRCVLGFATQSSVQIYYSSFAAETAHVTFTPAFMMLANQI